MTSHHSDTQPRSRRALKFGGRRKWLLLGVVAVATGLAFGWKTLAVAGLGPILIALLPCAILCALGLVAMKKF